MVKPQSSKLITRVRFPSSPRDLGSRRFRVEALSFSLEGMTGIPSACGFVSSRARNPHAPARHPLAQIPAKVAGNRLRLKVPKAFETFRLQPVIPSRTVLNESAGIPSACGFVSSRARNPHAPARHPLAQIPAKVAGNRLRLKVPKAFETFRLQPVIPSRTVLNESAGIPSACGFVSSRARNPHAPARHPLTAHPHKTPYKTKGDRGVRAQWK